MGKRVMRAYKVDFNADAKQSNRYEADGLWWKYRGVWYSTPLSAGTEDTVFVRRIDGFIVVCSYNTRIGYVAVDIHLPDESGAAGCLASQLVNYWEFPEYDGLNERISGKTACLRLARYLLVNVVEV